MVPEFSLKQLFSQPTTIDNINKISVIAFPAGYVDTESGSSAGKACKIAPNPLGLHWQQTRLGPIIIRYEECIQGRQ